MNLIDNADVYGFDWGGEGFGACEELLGRVIKAKPDLRDQIVLSTKGGIVPPVPYDSSRQYLRSACEASLKRLQVEQIDLYQIHRPDIYTHPNGKFDRRILGCHYLDRSECSYFCWSKPFI